MSSLERCPPLMTTSDGPSARIRLAASRRSSSAAMAMPASASASGMFGVTTNAFGRRRFHRFDRVVCGQAVSALRKHDGIDDDERNVEVRDRPGHRFDCARRCQHSRLCGIRAEIDHYRLDLLADEFRRHFGKRHDAAGVLRGYCGDGGGAVDAVGGERLEVCLDPRAGA